MATFTRFEDIDGWKMARELTGEIYRLTSAGAVARDFGRAFISFLSMARGSGVELKSRLYVALDTALIKHVDFDRQYPLAGGVEGMISGLMKYLSQSSPQGRKFYRPNREP